MISQTVLDTPVSSAVSGTLRVPVTRRHVAGLRAAAYRFAVSVRDWVSIPVVPYAALWEASFIAGQADGRKTFKTDSWPRG